MKHWNVVYLLCGVPASGKSWVCEQLKDKFVYVPHDLNKSEIVDAVHSANEILNVHHVVGKSILLDCPFGETKLKAQLEHAGFKVIPYFIVETPQIIEARYVTREKKALPKNVLTRATTILDRAKEWGALYGTSQEILEALKQI